MSELSPECAAKRTSVHRSEFMVSCPDGGHACDKLTRRAKFRLTRRANHFYKFARLTRQEGRIAIVTKRGMGCGGRGGIVRAIGTAGRASRPVSGHRACRRAVLKRTVKSCGPGASMVGVKSAEGKSARPGADEPAIRRRRRQPSPILRGDHDISRKAIAQGMSDCLRCPVCSCALSFALLHTRPRVQRASGIPCSLLGGRTKPQASGRPCREKADVRLVFENESQLSQRHCE